MKLLLNKCCKALIGSALVIATLAPLVTSAQTSPSAYTAGTRYDLAGRPTGTIQPDPDGGGARKYLATRNTYNAIGLLVTTEQGSLTGWPSEEVPPAAWSGYGWTLTLTNTFTYDSWGRKVTAMTSASNGVSYALTQYSYDSMNRVECTAERMNRAVYNTIISSLPNPCAPYVSGTGSEAFGNDRITKTSYDSYGQVLQVRKAFGTALDQLYVTNTYKAKGLKSSVKDANGNLTYMAYDSLGRMTEMYFPSQTTKGQYSITDYEAYRYDANSNRISLKKRNSSQTILYDYDALNQLTFKNLPGAEPDVYSMYDNRGLQTYARFGSTTGLGVRTVFNGFGQIINSISSMSGLDRTLTFSYDANGNRTKVTHPDGNFFGYDYDGINLLKSIGENAISASEADASRIMSPHFLNDTAQINNILFKSGASTNFLFDDVMRLKSFAHDFSGTAQDTLTSFAYNPVNQITSRTISNSTFYSYSGNQNITGTYGVNNLNQYTGAGGKTFTYDLNGNFTSDGCTTFVYDSENRLISTSAISACGKTATLSYDPMGRLFQTNGGGLITQFLYDGDALVAEYNTSGTVLRRYVHGSRVDEPFAWYEGSAVNASVRRNLHTDNQGSIIAVSNNSNTVTNFNTYDVYGIPGANNSLSRFSYTGQIYLPEIGLYYYKARIYNPKLGRFAQTDPIGYEDQMNLYAYVGNDPFNKNDPSGKEGCVQNFCYQTAQNQLKTVTHEQQGALKYTTTGAMPSKLPDSCFSKCGVEQMAQASAAANAAASTPKENPMNVLRDAMLNAREEPADTSEFEKKVESAVSDAGQNIGQIQNPDTQAMPDFKVDAGQKEAQDGRDAEAYRDEDK